MTIAILFILFLIVNYYVTTASSSVIEVDSNGNQHEINKAQPKSVRAKFINALPSTEVNLYWIGNVGIGSGGGSGVGGPPKLFYGPISPNGGERIVEGFDGQVFLLTTSGTIYERLGEFTISTTTDKNEQQFILTEDIATQTASEFPPQALQSQARSSLAKSCRSIKKSITDSTKASSCRECASVVGCGYSPVRANSAGSNVKEACYLAHPVATVNDETECNELYDNALMSDVTSKSVDAWLNKATALTLGDVEGYEYGPRSLRMAYRHSELAVERSNMMMADSTEAKNDKSKKAAAISALKKANVSLSELNNKLDAVFDDDDALELLASSRHPALASIHPNMPAVPRRTVEEAKLYIVRGEPVVITDAFGEGNAITSPVAHKWTLKYLSRRVFVSSDDGVDEPSFNIAADVASRCCRYFDPQKKAQTAEYPYPFLPSTHLYRDTFDGFVKTIRKGYHLNGINSSNSTTTKPISSKKVLHYLHEIIMNSNEEASVAGGSAPQQLTEDMHAITALLRPIASNQPFFGHFNSAKLWIGQQGIVMPNHYDATDNMYVMAWGRKRAIIGEPGQLDALYRYPNEHPLAGSSQVNLTSPDLDRYPNFNNSRLREVIVGPGDILYLPAWWWHQFEQPFDDTAALNFWSKDRKNAPSANMRDMRIREHALADQLERSVVQIFGNEAGIILSALANKNFDTSIDKYKLEHAKKELIAAAESWRQEAINLPGGHPKSAQSAAELVQEHLDLTYRDVIQETNGISNWKPGDSWDLSQTAKLPRELRERCEPAPESSPFMSLCD
jgi:hypothetical protein